MSLIIIYRRKLAMYNSDSKTGQAPHGPTLRGLVSSGADLLKQIYDVHILFPSASTVEPQEASEINYPITVRATGFTVPEVSVGAYDIKYHGFSVKRPNGNVEGDRQIELTFREDAAFMLRARFTTWMMAVVDPVTGGISNSINWFGTLSVSTIAGEYTAAQMVNPTGDSNKSGGLLESNGAIPESNTDDSNPIVTWYFYHVWVSKVGGVDFSTDGSEANQFAVTFQYQDCDLPGFGGNKFNVQAADSVVTNQKAGLISASKVKDKVTAATGSNQKQSSISGS